MEVGKRIRTIREEKHLTLEEVALRIGVAKQTIYKYESGIITNIPLDKLEQIATCLGCTPAYLMG